MEQFGFTAIIFLQNLWYYGFRDMQDLDTTKVFCLNVFAKTKDFTFVHMKKRGL